MLRVSRPLACAGVLVLAVTLAGCGGSDKAAPVNSPVSSPSSSQGSASPELQKVIDRVEQAGAGTFTQSDAKVAGTPISASAGSYDLHDDTLAATIRIPDGATKRVATALVRVVGGKAYLQVDQWKAPARTCWLTSTPSALSTDYALDVSSSAVPLAVALLKELTFDSSSGSGTYQGHLPISAVLPLLSGTIKQELRKSDPQGEVAVFVTDDGTTVTVTVPGYTLASALSTALKVDESSFSDIQGERYVASARPAPAAAAIQAPAVAKQMSAADLKADRCG